MAQQPLTDTFFDSFDLHPNLISGLHGAGFTRCTPIQALTLPVALLGQDVAGQAQTGTGKTAAFLVAIMQRLLTKPAFAERGTSDPRALIIAPTRELAIQIEKDFQSLGRDTGLKSALIYGGIDYDKQRQQLRDGVDLIIATPGRLIDYFKQHIFSFRAVEVMVIDEADRMFDLGFIKDVRFLLRRLPERERRQCLLFSATLSHRVLELAYEHMNSPEKLTVESENVTADRVRQVVYFPSTEEKLPLLVGLLSRMSAQRSMIFVNMKVAAEKVARRLERQGFAVGMLSGDVPQKKRQTLLGKFERGEIELLIATDVAARGLHVADVSHVFNYDLPQDAEDYVHRIGRTARLGAEGDAVSFACDMYAQGLPDIEAYIGQKIPVARVDPELLIAPPPRPRAPGAESFADGNDDESGGMSRARSRTRSGPPSRGSAGAGSSRSGAGRSSSGRSGSGSSGHSRSEPSRSQSITATDGSAVPASAIPAPSAAAGEHSAATTGVPKRHRGGRGRRGGGGSEGNRPAENQRGAENRGSGSETPRSNRPRDRKGEGFHPQVAALPASPTAGKAAAPGAERKIGFFERLSRLFTRR